MSAVFYPKYFRFFYLIELKVFLQNIYVAFLTNHFYFVQPSTCSLYTKLYLSLFLKLEEKVERTLKRATNPHSVVQIRKLIIFLEE